MSINGGVRRWEQETATGEQEKKAYDCVLGALRCVFIPHLYAVFVAVVKPFNV